MFSESDQCMSSQSSYKTEVTEIQISISKTFFNQSCKQFSTSLKKNVDWEEWIALSYQFQEFQSSCQSVVKIKHWLLCACQISVIDCHSNQ